MGLPEVVESPGTAQRTDTTELSGADATPFCKRLAALPAAKRERTVLELVRAQAAVVLGHDSPAAVEPQWAFKDLGFDSPAAVELRDRLTRLVGLRLPKALLFDHPDSRRARPLFAGRARGRRWIGPGGVGPGGVGTGGEARSPIARGAGRDRGDELPLPGEACAPPEQLWELVAGGGDAIGGFPTDRGWDLDALYHPDPAHPRTSHAREGGFLHDAGEFDASFFRIGPREALAMDPQQRLLLEVCWEAFEHVGIDPASLRGSPTGVFAGIRHSAYGEGAGVEDLEGYRLTGSNGSVASGRVAYALGLEGPAVSIDTACSSSLVAVHLACGALRAGECSLALAGGVAVMATPELFIEFSRQRGLAGDGRCKAFAESADGTCWGEGVGVLLLEPLGEAQRNGHRVLALLRGSAINQDGASNGLTAPSGPAQQRVIRQALASAGLTPVEVDAVEAHGTGTRLGDPIEAQALLAAYGQGREAERPLWLGSIKSNIGHTAAAAGVAGVIKMVMALQRERLPRTLHVEEPSREIDWAAGGVSLLTEEVPWPASGRPRRAGVSSFGISGTNAHVILEEAPAVEHLTQPDPEVRVGMFGGGVAVPVALSGKGPRALRAQAARLGEFVGQATTLAVEDVALSLTARPVFEHRAVVLADAREQLLDGLAALGRGEPASGVVQGVAPPAAGAGERIVFLFPGQGSQWEGMAVELLDSSPVFAEQMRACEEALAPFVDWSLEGVLRGGKGAPGLDRVDVVQPALFAVMVSLAECWRSCGVHPDVVVGHSQGEIAAAYVAGGLVLEDAARVVALRSQALVRLAGKGGMVSLALPCADLTPRLERWGSRVAVAAVNGPSSVVVSGDLGALEELLAQCETENIRARRISVNYASHSAQVEEIRDTLLQTCAPIAPRQGNVRFYSTVTGGPLDTTELTTEYWYRSLRETVQFEQVTRALLAQEHRAFIEISPHPVLTVGVHETIDRTLNAPNQALVAGTLRRNDGGPRRLQTSLAEVWVRGVDVDWGAMLEGSGARRVGLPTYAFQRERYWVTPSEGAGDVESLGQSSAEHPLLGAVVALAGDGGCVITGRISLSTHPWLADHAVMGVALLPGTAFLELALHAGSQVGCPTVEELVLEAPLVLGEQGSVWLQVVVGAHEEEGKRSVGVFSREQDSSEGRESIEEGWTRHAGGVLASEGRGARNGHAAWNGHAAVSAAWLWPPVGGEAIDVDRAYDRLASQGYEYGPVFQGLRAAWRCGEEVFAEVALPEDQRELAGNFGVHPALLDSALHAAVLGGLLDGDGEGRSSGVRLPFAFGGVELHGSGATSLRVRLSRASDGSVALAAADAAGGLVASVQSLVAREVSLEQLGAVRGGHRGSLLTVDWVRAAPTAEESSVDGLALLSTGDSVLAQSLARAGCSVAVFPTAPALGEAVDGGAALPGVVLLDCTALASDEALPVAARSAVERVLSVAQVWLADERFAGSQLVVVTQRAVAANRGEDVTALAQAPVWGLVRSAQSEHPGRFLLVDIDGQDVSVSALRAVLAGSTVAEETQLVVREGVVRVPRLVQSATSGALLAPDGVPAWRLDAGKGEISMIFHSSHLPRLSGNSGSVRCGLACVPRASISVTC